MQEVRKLTLLRPTLYTDVMLVDILSLMPVPGGRQC